MVYLNTTLHFTRSNIQCPEMVHVIIQHLVTQRILKIQNKMELRDNLVKPLHFISNKTRNNKNVRNEVI